MRRKLSLIVLFILPESLEKRGLNNLFNVKKEKDEAYIRTCGATQSVKSSDITKDIKEPLSLKYKEWLGNIQYYINAFMAHFLKHRTYKDLHAYIYIDHGHIIHIIYIIQELKKSSLTIMVEFLYPGSLSAFSRIIPVYYCKCCNLIGYSTRYLFLDR